MIYSISYDGDVRTISLKEAAELLLVWGGDGRSAEDLAELLKFGKLRFAAKHSHNPRFHEEFCFSPREARRQAYKNATLFNREWIFWCGRRKKSSYLNCHADGEWRELEDMPFDARLICADGEERLCHATGCAVWRTQPDGGLKECIEYADPSNGGFIYN